MGGYAHVFCRPDAAFGAGHVAWGFQALEKKNGTRIYYYGSYDNNNNDEGGLSVWYRYGTGQEMVMKFRNEDGYAGWKYLWVPNANPQAAFDVQHKWINRFYFALGSNCMNTVYDILRAYGTSALPYPGTNWRPKDWFNNFHGFPGKFPA